MSKRVVAIVQARMGSERLPGKVMMDICGMSMIGRVVSRLAAAQRIDDVVIVTPERDRSAIPSFGVPVEVGSDDDVLFRYYQAALVYHADVIVRVTGDCPLIDPALVDECIEAYHDSNAEYVSNWAFGRSYPRGMDVEAFSMRVLAKAFTETPPKWREHVTPWMYEHGALYFNVQGQCVGPKSPLYRPDLRLCVDTAEDLELVREIYHRLGPDPECAKIVALCREHPEIVCNRCIEQRKIAT